METSYTKVSEILKIENFRSRAYADGMSNGKQMYSIGYGHQIQPNESYLLNATITLDTALKLFRSNLAPLESQINDNSKYAMAQNQFDDCIDFGFNCGSGALSNILDTWNTTHDPIQVAARMKLYNKTRKNGVLVVDAGLTARRADEANDFLTSTSGISLIAVFAVGAALALYAYVS